MIDDYMLDHYIILMDVSGDFATIIQDAFFNWIFNDPVLAVCRILP